MYYACVYIYIYMHIMFISIVCIITISCIVMGGMLLFGLVLPDPVGACFADFASTCRSLLCRLHLVDFVISLITKDDEGIGKATY